MMTRSCRQNIKSDAGICAQSEIFNQQQRHDMTEEQYENVMRELAEIKEQLWSQESQQQLVDTLTEMTTVLAKQTEVSEKQKEVFERVEKILSDEYEEPEPEPLMS